MNITDILNKQEQELIESAEAIKVIEDKRRAKTEENCAKVIESINLDPSQPLNSKELYEGFHGDLVIDAMMAVIAHRPLTNEEITDHLLTEVARHYAKREEKHSPAAEALFNSLETYEQKCRLALFHCAMSGFYVFCPSAKAFLETEVKFIADRDAPNRFRVDTCYFSKLNTKVFDLAFTRSNYTGIDEIADSILKLISMGYTGNQINVMERHLSANGVINLNIEKASEGIFSVNSGRYVEHKATGADPKQNLMNALHYIADNQWYEQEESEEESFL
jgi:hypothetical protein